MTESKVYKFEDSNSNWMPLIASMFQNKGLDSTALLSMLNNGGFGGMGGGYWFIWIIFLWMMWGNNGWGNRNGQQGLADLGNLINNDNGRELLMSAIQGNGQAISQLASTLNCSVNSVQQSINAVMTQIQNVGNQVGMTGQQVINAIQQGNCQLGSQLAQCCCDIREAVTRQGYENQIATLNQTNTLTTAINNVATGQERGFSSVAYETQRQTCDIENAIKDSTAKIMDGQRAAEMRELQNKIDALREANSQKDTVINNGQQTAIFSQMIQNATAPLAGALANLQNDVNGVKCKLPETVSVQWPNLTAIPTSYLYGNYGLGLGYNTFGSCGCNNSLWG